MRLAVVASVLGGLFFFVFMAGLVLLVVAGFHNVGSPLSACAGGTGSPLPGCPPSASYALPIALLAVGFVGGVVIVIVTNVMAVRYAGMGLRAIRRQRRNPGGWASSTNYPPSGQPGSDPGAGMPGGPGWGGLPPGIG